MTPSTDTGGPQSSVEFDLRSYLMPVDPVEHLTGASAMLFRSPLGSRARRELRLSNARLAQIQERLLHDEFSIEHLHPAPRDVKQRAVLSRKKLSKISLAGRSLARSSLTECSFSESDFSQSSLARASATECELDRCFGNAINACWSTWPTCRFSNCRFKNLWFIASIFSNCVFDNCAFELCKFVGARMKNVHFHKSQILNCDFTRATLDHVELSQATVSHSSFNSADLSTAIVSSSASGNVFEERFGDCSFFNCKWPAGSQIIPERLRRRPPPMVRIKDWLFADFLRPVGWVMHFPELWFCWSTGFAAC